MATVEFYTTSATGFLKTKKDIQSMRFLLEAKKIQYTEYDVASDAEKLAAMREASGVKILPQLFVNGKFVGTWDVVEDLEETEKLDDILKNGPQ